MNIANRRRIIFKSSVNTATFLTTNKTNTQVYNTVFNVIDTHRPLLMDNKKQGSNIVFNNVYVNTNIE